MAARLRDSYDLCLISPTVAMGMQPLAEAVAGCFADRDIPPHVDPSGLSAAFAELNAAAWKKMVSRPGYTAGLGSLDTAQAEIAAFHPPRHVGRHG